MILIGWYGIILVIDGFICFVCVVGGIEVCIVIEEVREVLE